VRGRGTISQMGLGPGGGVDSWTAGVYEFAGGSCGSGAATVETSGMDEAS
jgi:hypothetical protein